jgi:hypothetical protein
MFILHMLEGEGARFPKSTTCKHVSFCCAVFSGGQASACEVVMWGATSRKLNTTRVCGLSTNTSRVTSARAGKSPRKYACTTDKYMNLRNTVDGTNPAPPHPPVPSEHIRYRGIGVTRPATFAARMMQEDHPSSCQHTHTHTHTQQTSIKTNTNEHKQATSLCPFMLPLALHSNSQHSKAS